jgi:acyl carrier protein
LARENAAQKLIQTCDAAVEASTLRRHLNNLEPVGVDPESFWSWGQAHGYSVRVSWSANDPSGCYDVQVVDRRRPDQVPQSVPHRQSAPKSWGAYANDPLESNFRQQLIPQLREYLKERMPEYMVPSAWMALKELPLTPNGKVNRRALPVPQSRVAEVGEYVAPATELERTLAEIWAQVLRVDQVGMQDNFFDLGGHSLFATQVVVRVQTALSIDMPLKLLFEHPTLSQLAGEIDRLREAKLLEEMSADGSPLQELMKEVDSLSEEEVREWVQKLEIERRP